jgi:iron complex transport system substrate-binding protein
VTASSAPAAARHALAVALLLAAYATRVAAGPPATPPPAPSAAATTPSAASTRPSPVPWRAVDDAGHQVILDHPARRIVTLAPHLAELVFAAGAGDRLVGVSRYTDAPAEAASRPVVGDAFALDFEAISKLQPDLVLAWGSGTSERAKARLRQLGFKVYEVEIRDVAGLAGTLRHIGEFAGTQAVAGERARDLLADWDALQARYGHRTPVRVFYQLWDAPLMTLSGRHLISTAIRACGGRNVFEDLPTLTAPVGWEDAVRRDPQLVVTAGSPSEAAHAGRWSTFPQVSATRHHQFARLDGDLIARSGPRFVAGAQQLCEAIDRARRGARQPDPTP